MTVFIVLVKIKDMKLENARKHVHSFLEVERAIFFEDAGKRIYQFFKIGLFTCRTSRWLGADRRLCTK